MSVLFETGELITYLYDGGGLYRIGAATTLAAGGEVSQRVIQTEGRWKSSESYKVYTRNNPEDAGIVSRKLAETGKIGQRHPGQRTAWGRTP